MTKSKLSDWVHIYSEIVKRNYNSVTIKCPNCNKEQIDFRLIGNEKSRIGYSLIWCNDCLLGIHLSRIQIPKGIDMIPIDNFEVEINVPEFTRITK